MTVRGGRMSWRHSLLLVFCLVLVIIFSGCDEEESDPPSPSYSFNIIANQVGSDPVLVVSIEIKHTDEDVALTVEGEEVSLGSDDEYTSSGSITVDYDTLLTMEVFYGETTFYDTLRLREYAHIYNFQCNDVTLIPNTIVTIPFSQYFVLEWDNGLPLDLQELNEDSYSAWHTLSLYWSVGGSTSVLAITEDALATDAVFDDYVIATFARDLGYSLSSSLENGLSGRTSISRVVAFRAISYSYYFVGNGL